MAGVFSSTVKGQHGGRRPGAGRKKRGRWKEPAHAKRQALSSKHPVHVTLRIKRYLPRLRQRCVYEAIRRVLARYIANADFRAVHVSIQNNHLHLIVEAANKRELTRGMQSFAINAARAINSAWQRRGKIFQFRYAAKQITTAAYARNAIAYVLNNWRRHDEDLRSESKAVLDEYSSAVSFTGWAGNKRYRPPPGYEPLPVSEPTTHLMMSNWQRFGLIDPFERPATPW